MPDIFIPQISTRLFPSYPQIDRKYHFAASPQCSQSYTLLISFLEHPIDSHPIILLSPIKL